MAIVSIDVIIQTSLLLLLLGRILLLVALLLLPLLFLFLLRLLLLDLWHHLLSSFIHGTFALLALELGDAVIGNILDTVFIELKDRSKVRFSLRLLRMKPSVSTHHVMTGFEWT